MQSVPMKMPRSRRLRTAYHIVDASLGPLTGYQGSTGFSEASVSPAATSWRRVATRPSL